MWEKLFDSMAKVFTLTADVARHEKDIETFRRDNKELLAIINQQSAKIEVPGCAV